MAERGISCPPVIVVCQNTAIRDVYDYIAASTARMRRLLLSQLEHGRLALFDNFDRKDRQSTRPAYTLLIDRELESGDAIAQFSAMATDETEHFVATGRAPGDGACAETITDQELPREVMNTSQKDQLGAGIRASCPFRCSQKGGCHNVIISRVRAFGSSCVANRDRPRARRLVRTQRRQIS